MTGHEASRRAYRLAVASFAVAIVGGIVAAIGYATDHTSNFLGLGLAAALLGIGFGLVAWTKFLDLDEHVVQLREPITMSPDQRDELRHEIATTSETIGRRPMLVWLSVLSGLSLFVGFVGPIGSLGPKPRGERSRTAWRQGVRLVTSDGTAICVESVGLDQLATVFPEHHVGRDDSQVVLLRVREVLLSSRTVERGAVNGWVAYSKICTHAGCSVGLFGIDDRPPDVLRQLVCPCHQSVFDPLDSAKPVGGPAPRSLPQLRLGVDGDGYLIALSDFDGPVGPIAWDEG